MNRENKKTTDHKLKKLGPRLLIILGLFVVLGFYLYAYSPFSPRNYAAELAKPIEKNLVGAGAIKKCEEADGGRFFSNRSPWHYAQYEIAGDANEVTALVRTSLKNSGYSLVDGDRPGTPRDNNFYADKSKDSPFDDLEEGKVDVRITIFGSADSDGSAFCGVTQQDNPPVRHRVVRVMVSLPAFK